MKDSTPIKLLVTLATTIILLIIVSTIPRSWSSPIVDIMPIAVFFIGIFYSLFH